MIKSPILIKHIFAVKAANCPNLCPKSGQIPAKTEYSIKDEWRKMSYFITSHWNPKKVHWNPTKSCKIPFKTTKTTPKTTQTTAPTVVGSGIMSGASSCGTGMGSMVWTNHQWRFSNELDIRPSSKLTGSYGIRLFLEDLLKMVVFHGCVK